MKDGMDGRVISVDKPLFGKANKLTCKKMLKFTSYQGNKK